MPYSYKYQNFLGKNLLLNKYRVRKKQITNLSSLVKNQGEIFEPKRSVMHSKISPCISKAKNFLIERCKAN